MSSVSGTGDHDAFYDAAAAYVLGALVDEDLGRFTVHLEGCTACREEVARLQVAADALPLAAPQFTPPPALKQRIMVAVGAGAGEREAQGAGEAFQAHEVEDDVPAPRVGRSRPARRSANGSPRRWTVGAVGALAAAAIVLAVVALAGLGLERGRWLAGGPRPGARAWRQRVVAGQRWQGRAAGERHAPGAGTAHLPGVGAAGSSATADRCAVQRQQQRRRDGCGSGRDRR